MFDALLADGLAGGMGEKVATYAVKCLAVAGGFLVGYLIGGRVAWALDRWVFAQKAPDQLKKAVSIASGLALAIVIALVVFGDGGGGLFGRGGGSGDSKGAPSNDDKGKTAPTAPEPKKDEPPRKKDEPKLPPPPPTPGDMRVAILSGDDVRDGKFYSFDDDPTPRNFEEFKRYILDRKKATKTELTIIFRYKKESLAGHPEIIRMRAWVDQEKLHNHFE